MKIFKEWIRIPGVIATIAVVGLIYFAFQLLSGVVLKDNIEKYGSQAVGAKVDLSSASVSLLPPSFALRGLQVTDPESPMQNLVEVDELSASVNLYHLVVGRVVIDELNYTGLQFSTQRSTSGAVDVKQQVEAAEDQTEVSALDNLGAEIPDADAILAKETLLSQTLAEELGQDYQRCESQWQTQKEQLESADQYSAWADEIQQLTSGEIGSVEIAKQRLDQLKEVREQIKAELGDLKQAKELLSACKKDIAEKTAALKNAPQKDIERLNEKYFSGAQSALGNVTELLFGDDIAMYLEKAQSLYGSAKPILAALSSDEQPVEEPEPYGGEAVRFEEVDPQADFSIRRMQGDVSLPAGRLSVAGQDINADHPQSGKPSVITVGGDQIERVENLSATLSFDRREPDKPADDYQLSINKYQLDDFVLSEDGSLPLVLGDAVVDVQGEGSYTPQGFKADFVADFSDAEFIVGDQASNTVKQVFNSMASELSNFKLTFAVSSQGGSLKTSLGSNLDSIIGSGLKKALKEQVRAEKDKLQAQLKQQAAVKIEQLAKDQQWLAGADQSLASGDKSLNEMLDSALKDPVKQYQEQEKAKLEAELEAKKKAEKERAKSKLKERFGF